MESLWVRGAIGAILVVGFGISGFYRARARRADPTANRRDESSGLIALRVFVALPLFFILIGSLLAPEVFNWAAFAVSPSVQLVGIAVATLGVPLAAWLFPHLGNNVTATTLVKEEHQLVTTGPYRFVRHPLYLTGLLLLGGAGLALGNWVVLASVLAFVPTWKLIVIPREEAELEGRFGQAYVEYRRRTGAFIPRVC